MSDLMDHAQARDSFSAYLEGELAGRTRADLEAHLSDCEACRTELAALRLTVGQLGALKHRAPPALLPSIQQQIFRRSRGRFFNRRWLLFGRIPFEWVSLISIIVMLLYYIATLQSTPTGVTPAP